MAQFVSIEVVVFVVFDRFLKSWHQTGKAFKYTKWFGHFSPRFQERTQSTQIMTGQPNEMRV